MTYTYFLVLRLEFVYFLRMTLFSCYLFLLTDSLSVNYSIESKITSTIFLEMEKSLMLSSTRYFSKKGANILISYNDSELNEENDSF